MNLETELKELRTALEQEKGKFAEIQRRLDQLRDRAVGLEREVMRTLKAQAILQQVAQKTQQELQYRISELCSLALYGVFEEPYELVLEFVVRRGKTEADIYFLRDGERVDPLTAAGGGVVDVASFALRMALWTLKQPRSRNVILLDEPFRFVSRELQPKASAMLKELSRRLGVQFIMVSHSTDLVAAADKVFECAQNSKGISIVKEAE